MDSKHKRLNFVDSELANLKEKNLQRRLRYGKIQGSHITIKGKKLLNLCSNDYLGIISNKIKIDQLQSSSRLVSGNDESYHKLEEALAKHKSQKSSLIYPTGYMANLGAISSIAKKGDLILSDELNHASIIEACKISGAKTIIYKHNDMQDLQKKIKQSGKNKFIVTEGIFSMDGDMSLLKEITETSEKQNALCIVDDAHGDFVVGQDGKGTPEYFSVAKKIDIYISSLSKGLGSFGGYVASHKNIVDLQINKSRSFIYTSALPGFLVEHSWNRFNSNRNRQKTKLEKNTKQLIEGLKEIGFEIKSNTHIIPIIIGDEKKALDCGKYLLNNGVFAQPIRYPTVKKGQARLRLSVTALLTNKEIEDALVVFKRMYQKFLQ